VALFGGIDGLDVCRRVAEQIERFLKPNGVLMLEIGYSQGPGVKDLLEQTGAFRHIEVEKDHTRNDRLVIAGRAEMQSRSSMW
jgi:release factor glutamine methyltransferase